MNNYNTIFNEILKKYGNSEKWSGSIFEKMKQEKNKKKIQKSQK